MDLAWRNIPVTCERSFSSDFTSTIESEEEKVFDSLIGRILRPCDALMEMVLGFWRQGGRKSTLGCLFICYFRDLFIRGEKKELLSRSRVLFTFFLEKLRNLAWMFSFSSDCILPVPFILFYWIPVFWKLRGEGV